MVTVANEAVICIHGRFQPFHIGHLDYTLSACQLGETVIIGITNAEPSHIKSDPAAPHRHLRENNPYTYYMRVEMIRGALKDASIDLERLRFVPYPIHSLNTVDNYVPDQALHVITVLDGWGDHKLEMLRSAGLRVHAFRDLPRKTSGTEIRKRLRLGLPIIGMVPQYVNEYLHRPDVLKMIEKDSA